MEKFQSLADLLGGVPAVGASADTGTVGHPELTVKDFCAGVLESLEYRRSVLDRILLGTLPPAVESLMYHYAYGKPVERVEHSGKVETITEVRRVLVRVEQQQPEEAEAPYTTH